MSSQQRSIDRRAFLRQARQVAKAVAVGLGMLLIPGTAQAAQMTCCPNSNCPVCPGSDRRFRCQGSCPSFCTCHPNTGGQCYTIVC